MYCVRSCTVTAVFLFSSLACQSQGFDANLVKSINKNSSTFKDNFFKADANSVAIINIAAPLAIFTTGLVNKNKQLQKDAAYMLGGYIVSTIITQGAKRIIKRDRPFVTYPDIVKKSDGGGYSMPSGHTSAAFCTATSLSLLFPKWYVIAPAYLWAASVGYARMYQGVHYPSDVLVGAIVGAGSAWLAYKVQHCIDKKNASKKTTAAPLL